MTTRALSRIFVTRVAVKPGYSVAYPYELTPRVVNAKRPEKNTANGMLSDKAQKRIKNAASWLQFLSRGMLVYSKQRKRHTKCKLVFITLTVPRYTNHPDVFFVGKCLSSMLKYLQRQHGCHLYIWKAEIQPKRYYSRGERCIHFHITTNRFVHHRQLRNKWNDILRKNGVIDVKQNPPSTEIRAVRNEKGFALYLAKYISKKETDPALKVNCKVWGCSHSLSRINVTLGEDLNDDFHSTMYKFTSGDTVEKKKTKHCVIYFTSLSDRRNLSPELQETVARVRDEISMRKPASTRPGKTDDGARSGMPAKPLVRWIQSDLFPS